MHTEQKKGNCEKTQESRTHGTIISSEFSSLDAEKVKRKKNAVKLQVETCVSIQKVKSLGMLQTKTCH